MMAHTNIIKEIENRSEVDFVQNLIQFELEPADVENEIPEEELVQMEAEFEDFWEERHAV